MKTKRDLERLAELVGATLEEDSGWRDMRVFQIIAPKGQRWISDSVVSIKIEWAKGHSESDRKYNESEFALASERVACGFKPIPAEDLYLYAED